MKGIKVAAPEQKALLLTDDILVCMIDLKKSFIGLSHKLNLLKTNGVTPSLDWIPFIRK